MNITLLMRGNTLAVCGLEEPRNSQELLIESVGPFCFVLCFMCTAELPVSTDGRTDRQMDRRMN